MRKIIENKKFFDKKVEIEIEKRLNNNQWDIEITNKVFQSVNKTKPIQRRSVSSEISSNTKKNYYNSTFFKVINSIAAAAMILFVVQFFFHPFNGNNNTFAQIDESNKNLATNKKNDSYKDPDSLDFTFEVDYDNLIEVTLNQR